jgi:uncharacterized protein
MTTVHNPTMPTNRLAREASPYLLQHQHNPVDWYPWGEQAFTQAREQDKPIFLSIGYSTCHWCHVMERESFENPDIARILNDHFVSIKVDREERPDVDKIYMSFVQATTGHGGWPLSAFLTPDRKPFFGGTYFPPESRHGRPGFPQVLLQIHQLWQESRDKLLGSANGIHQKLVEIANTPNPDLPLTPNLLHHAAQQFKAEYDPQHGGFGNAPKFPRPSQPAFLLAYATQYHDPDATRMVLHTCDRMAAGGMYDQLGGGFARYSVDAEWLVPHFEKMLYDNAQLVQLYLDAFLVSGQTRFAQIARDILRYVLRDLTHPDGGFYSAEDADSEGHEGKFYSWTVTELQSLLNPDELAVTLRHFGVTPQGNFTDHSHPQPLPHLNVLSIVDPQLTPAEQTLLSNAKHTLFDARSRRVRPHRDDKILSSWNGLMLGACARAGAVLQEPAFLQAAEKNLAFLQNTLWDAPSQTLYHRWRNSTRDSVQLLDAYAYLLAGVLDLYESTLNPAHLQFGVDLANAMIQRFHDPKHGGFWQSGPDASDLILRVKEDYDGAEPSGNSVATLALWKLAAITGNPACRQIAEQTLHAFTQRLQTLPQTLPYMALAALAALQEPHRVVLTGNLATPEGRQLLRTVHSVYQPLRVVLGTSGPVDPFAQSLPATPIPTASVCTGTACQPPTSDPAQLQRLLAPSPSQRPTPQM